MTSEKSSKDVECFNFTIHLIIFLANGLLALSTGGLFNFFFSFISVLSWMYIQGLIENIKQTMFLCDELQDYDVNANSIDIEYVNEFISTRM